MINIFDAIPENNYDLIKEIIHTNPHSVNLTGHSLNTPLHYACKMDKLNYEIIKLLIENGANPNAINKNNNSILHFLFYKEFLKWLLYDILA